MASTLAATSASVATRRRLAPERQQDVLVAVVDDRPFVFEPAPLQEAVGGGVAGVRVGVEGRTGSRSRKPARAAVAMPRPQNRRPSQKPTNRRSSHQETTWPAGSPSAVTVRTSTVGSPRILVVQWSRKASRSRGGNLARRTPFGSCACSKRTARSDAWTSRRRTSVMPASLARGADKWARDRDSRVPHTAAHTVGREPARGGPDGSREERTREGT